MQMRKYSDNRFVSRPTVFANFISGARLSSFITNRFFCSEDVQKILCSNLIAGERWFWSMWNQVKLDLSVGSTYGSTESIDGRGVDDKAIWGRKAACQLVDWLTDQPSDRPADRPIDWPIDWPVDRPTKRPNDLSTISRPTDWPLNDVLISLTVRMTNRLTDRLTGRPTAFPLTNCRTDKVIENNLFTDNIDCS